MTALKASEVGRFVERPDIDTGLFLAYGPDGGLVRETGAKLARRFAGADAEMNLVTLDGDELASEPGRLAVEARTTSLFGDRQVIRVRNASKSLVMTLTELLDGPPGWAIILEAGNLPPKDPLRALVEASRQGRALPCYADSDKAIEQLLAETFAQEGIRVDPDAMAALRDSLGNDREITRRELEKLVLFAAQSRHLTRQDVETLCADNAALVVDAVIDAAGAGNAEALDLALDRALAAAVNGQQVLAMAMAHFAALRRWRVLVDSGRSVSAVLDAARPRPHFSRRASLERQLRLWSDESLAAALERLQAASADSRKRYLLQDSVVRRGLLAVTMLAVSA